MRVNSIGSYVNKNSFKAHYTNSDVGASSLYGSLKLACYDENGKLVAKEKTTVFDKGDKRSEEAFTEKYAQKVADFEKKYEDVIKKADPDNEMILTGCFPGPVKGEGKNRGVMMTNFYHDDDRTSRFSKTVNLSDIDSYLTQKGVKLAKNSIYVNDMMAAGTCLLSKLQETHPETLAEGREILFLYPGGGLGSGEIVVDKDNIKIKPTEKQHAWADDAKTKRLEEEVCSQGILNNFFKEINASAELRKKFDGVTQYAAYPSYPEFEGTRNVSDEEFKQASKKTYDKTMDALAKIIANKIYDGTTKTAVLTGRIAKTVMESVNENDAFRQGKYSDIPKDEEVFTKIMKDKVSENLSSVGQSLMNDNGEFNIFYIPLSDNTEGEHLLQNGESVGTSWYNIKK